MHLRRAPALTAMRQRRTAAAALCAWASWSTACRAQTGAPVTQPAGTASQVQKLPDSPSATLAHAAVSGIVTDSAGAAIPQAQVTLSTDSPVEKFETRTSLNGVFSLPEMPSRAFTITVSCDGFAPVSVSGILHPGEDLEVPTFTLTPFTSDVVEVHATQKEIADGDIHMEEKQRLGGFLPNFFVVYDHNAPPLDAKQKWSLTFRSIFDYTTPIVIAAQAGVEQATNVLPGYGTDAVAYGERFGAALADDAIATVIGGYVTPVIFHQDPRYFYLGTGSIVHRTLYALASAVRCKGDNGHWQFNVSGITGDFAAGAFSNLYYPPGSRNGVDITLENGALAAVGDGVGNVIQELLFKHITPKVPDYNQTQKP